MKKSKQTGFTLIESIIVIVISSIIFSIVAVFIAAPIKSYFDNNKRADVADALDGATRRIARDLHTAIPNTVRSAGAQCLEYIAGYTGGRYRAEQDCSSGACTGNAVDTTTSTTTFDVLSTMSATPVAGDLVVIGNLGIPGADAYAGDTTAAITSASATTINLSGSKLFPVESPGHRFQVIANTEKAVTYACTNVGVDSQGNGIGVLNKYKNYGFVAAAPSTCTAPASAPSVVLNNVSSCNFTFDNNIMGKIGLATLQIGITKNNETVNIYHEVHVNNQP